jgi:predicted nucleic acid-binding protein
MRVLLDTCVLAELRLPQGAPPVKEFVGLVPPRDLFLSVSTVGEISKGVALLAEGTKKQALGAWLLGLTRQFEDRILPIDQEAASVWGELTAAAQKRGQPVPVADGLIAATAIRHGLHVATRNTGDFIKAGVMAVNPWLTPLGALQ